MLLASVALALVAPAATWADDPPAGMPATAATLAATAITDSTATFQATINPHGLPTTAHFEYGTTMNRLASTPDVVVGDGTVDVPFTVPVSALLPGRHYYVLVSATNSAGGERGSLIDFTTSPRPLRLPVRPSIRMSGSAITPVSATLRFTVTGFDGPVT
jgi:hypothetical protein